MAESFNESREKAAVLAEAYYKDRAVTLIKRFEDIPDTLNAFMAKTEKELDDLRQESEKIRRVWVEGKRIVQV